MTDLDLDSIRRRHDEDHEHDGGCDTLDLLAEVERLRADLRVKVGGAYVAEMRRAVERAEKAEDALERLRMEVRDPHTGLGVTRRALGYVVDERDRLQAAVDAVRTLADRDDLTYVRVVAEDGAYVALRSRQAVADMIHAALNEHLGSPDD